MKNGAVFAHDLCTSSCILYLLLIFKIWKEEKEHSHLLFYFPDACNEAGVGTEAKSQKLNLGLPSGLQGLNYVSYHQLLRRVGASWKPEPGARA